MVANLLRMLRFADEVAPDAFAAAVAQIGQGRDRLDRLDTAEAALVRLADERAAGA